MFAAQQTQYQYVVVICVVVIEQPNLGVVASYVCLIYAELGNCLPPVNFKTTCSTDCCCLLLFTMLLQFTHDDHQQLQCVLVLLSILHVWLLGQLSSIAVKQLLLLFFGCVQNLGKTCCCLIIQWWMLPGTSVWVMLTQDTPQQHYCRKSMLLLL